MRQIGITAVLRVFLGFLLLLGAILGALFPSVRWFFKYSSLPSPGAACHWVREETPIKTKWLQIQSPDRSVKLTFELEGATKECALSDGRKQKTITPANVYSTFTKDQETFTQVRYQPLKARNTFNRYMEEFAKDQAQGDSVPELLLEKGMAEDQAWFIPSKDAFVVARQVKENQYKAFYFYTGIVNGKPNIYLLTDKTVGTNAYDFRSLIGMTDPKDLVAATIERTNP